MAKQFTAGVVGASQESIFAIEEARKRGIKVIAIDGDKTAPGLICADEGHVIDIRDIDAVFDFFESNPVDFLLPVPVGRILTTTGFVNEHFGLPGVGAKAANLATDKWEFHKVLSEAGLRNAEAVLIDGRNRHIGAGFLPGCIGLERHLELFCHLFARHIACFT